MTIATMPESHQMTRDHSASIKLFDETRANAVLMGAALDMLGVLKSSEQTLRNLGNGELTGDAATIALNAAANIRVVIAKATGGK